MPTTRRQVLGTLLDVPYTERREAKRLGARYAYWLKSWYVPAGEPLVRFRCWLADDDRDRGPIDLAELLDDDVLRELRGIRARLSRVSKGPWEWAYETEARALYMPASGVPDFYGRLDLRVLLWAKKARRPVLLLRMDRPGLPSVPDAAFLAAAPDDIRFLLGEVERLRSLVDALQGSGLG